MATVTQQAPAVADEALQQPKEAMQMTNMTDDRPDVDASKASKATDTATAALDENANIPSPSAKGKEKESALATPPADKEASSSTPSRGHATSTTAASSSAQQDDSLSIEPTDAPAGTTTSSDLPVCSITLLLPTGARHPYRIDEKYLAKRNVDIPEVTESGKKDPFSISVYKLKELILREWRDEWEGKPASPSSIRLIHFGKLLDDKEQLKKYQFTADSPNVVHMSVRPAEMMEEDEAAKGKGPREGRTSQGSGGCCVIL